MFLFVFVFVFDEIYLYPWLFFDRFSPCIFPRPAKTHLVKDKMDKIILGFIPNKRAKVLLGMSEGLQGRTWFAKEWLQEREKSGRWHLDGTKCQMSSRKEQQNESSGNERENEPKIANLPKCKWMQGNAGGARANQDQANVATRGVGRQMPGSAN